jgi:hypothetical protein
LLRLIAVEEARERATQWLVNVNRPSRQNSFRSSRWEMFRFGNRQFLLLNSKPFINIVSNEESTHFAISCFDDNSDFEENDFESQNRTNAVVITISRQELVIGCYYVNPDSWTYVKQKSDDHISQNVGFDLSINHTFPSKMGTMIITRPKWRPFIRNIWNENEILTIITPFRIIAKLRFSVILRTDFKSDYSQIRLI